jgi:hypothetical protein
VGACRALELTQNDSGEGPVIVLLDSLAAIKRLQLRKASPGQSLAIRAHRAAQALRVGHSGIEGNERADQAAKAAAPPRETVIRKSLWPTPTGSARRSSRPENSNGPMAYEDARKLRRLLGRGKGPDF